jgi:site-specific DNA recombinase
MNANHFEYPSSAQAPNAKRMVLYARVSTEEQTKGNYPSCDSQIEELEGECRRRGWQVYRPIRDEGYTAATLKRPGLTEMRWLVQSGEIDGILCTWYDRLTRSREFYILDHEFRTYGVEFITLHDAADTRTAAGRFMESMIVAAKTYDRDQTSEKVRIKMRMRLEKGLHQGGLVPFGFTCDPQTKMLHPDPEQVKIVEQLFRLYVDSRSDFAVRDWLKAHQISAPHGGAVWQVSTIHDLLCNRRYIGEIEINRANKGLEDLPEIDAYRIVKAPHEPLISPELFELAQIVRREKAGESPHRVGRPRSYSRNRCGRVNVLQGVLLCGACGHAMAPHYTYKKPGKERKEETYIHYYVCARQIKGANTVNHKNRVPARLAEAWALETMQELLQTPGLIERAIGQAQADSEEELQPQQEAMALNRAALQENQAKIEAMLDAISSGQATGALFQMLNTKAAQLKLEREQLCHEQRHLQEALRPLEEHFDAELFRRNFLNFAEMAAQVEAEELQKLMRLFVRKIEWMPDGEHRAHYYLPRGSKATPKIGTLKAKQPMSEGLSQGMDWFATNIRSGGPDRIRTGGLLRDRQTC